MSYGLNFSRVLSPWRSAAQKRGLGDASLVGADVGPQQRIDPHIAAQSSGWIGVDLDGTLAYYDGWKGPDHIGKPVPAMAQRVRVWLAEGRDVRIFTARACELEQVRFVHAWSEKHFGVRLPVTNIKDFGMAELWDDRCVQVQSNTGRIVTEFSRRRQ